MVEVVTNVAPRLDLLPLVLWMTMARGVGEADCAARRRGDTGLLPVIALLLIQQQVGGQAFVPSGGGLEAAMLLLLMDAAG